MAIDTAAKRKGLIGMLLAPRIVLLSPNGSVKHRDRRVFSFSYPEDWRGRPYSDSEHDKASYPRDGAIR